MQRRHLLAGALVAATLPALSAMAHAAGPTAGDVHACDETLSPWLRGSLQIEGRASGVPDEPSQRTESEGAYGCTLV